MIDAESALANAERNTVQGIGLRVSRSTSAHPADSHERGRDVWVIWAEHFFANG
jgi:hypothetical protein